MGKQGGGNFSWREVLTVLWTYARPYKWRYAFIVLLFSLAPLAAIIEPVIYGRVIDTIVNLAPTNPSLLIPTLVPLVGLLIAANILEISFKTVGEYFSYRVADSGWRDFWRYVTTTLFHWDIARVQKEPVGQLARRLDRSGTAVWQTSGHTLREVIPSLVTIIAFVVVGLLLDWRMFLVALGTLPFILFFIAFFQKRVEDRQIKMDKRWDAFAGDLTEKITNLELIQAYAAEDRAIRQHLALQHRVDDAQMSVSKQWLVLNFGTTIAKFSGRLVILIAGAFFISRQSLTVGTLITFLSLLSLLFEPFELLLSQVVRRLAEMKSSFAKVIPALEEPNMVRDPAKPIHLKKVKGEVGFHDVTYRYPEKRKDALVNLSLIVQPGETVALVGHSGSGKSTFVRLVARFIDPTKGSITLDGVPLPELALKQVRGSLALVAQETQVWNASVLDNLRFVRPRSSEKDVRRALEQAQMWETVSALPKGLNTMLGERGVRLSGGERQRLSLARAFLANPPILILDESTSALDSETERKVQSAIGKLIKGRTSIIIAHRLSTIYQADRIIVLDHGKITEQGSHDELLAEDGHYAALWRLQSGGYLQEEE